MSRSRERKRNRMCGFDYSGSGYYFVTICTQNQELFFGDVKNGKMILNNCGIIANKCWRDLPNHYWNCKLDEFVIMPNHVHGIIVINNDIRRERFETVPYNLSEMIRGFKTFSSRRINESQLQNIIFRFKWQKSFYDHIIRNQKSLNNIRKYIKNNPINWDLDRNNPNMLA